MGQEQSAAEIKRRLAEWEKTRLAEHVRAVPDWKKEFPTRRGRIPLKETYTPADLNDMGLEYLKDFSFPGAFPYTRGVVPNMYRSEPWVMSAIGGFGTAQDSNKRWKFFLDQGLDGFFIVNDLPTQIGIDSDDPMAIGEVGRCGVAFDTLADVEEALDLPFEKIKQIYFISSSQSIVILAMIIAALEKLGRRADSFGLLIQNQPLKEYICRGLYIFPIEHAMKLATDVIEYCSEKHPNWVPITHTIAHFVDIFAPPGQSIGFCLAGAIAHIEAALKRGLKIDDFAPNMWVVKTTGPDVFEEVAEARALRKLWATIMQERFGAQKEESAKLKMIYHTAGIYEARQSPLNNIMRLTLQAMGAVLGGGQHISIACWDEALSIPTEEAEKIAIATHYILREEGGFANVADPMGGSYYLEYLTERNVREAMQYIKSVDALGGAIEATQQGFFQKQLEETMFVWQKKMQTGEIPFVGVNMLKQDQKPAQKFRLDPATEKRQIDRLHKVKRERNNSDVQLALSNVKDAAVAGRNLMEPIIAAVKTYASLGEICGVLREVFGEYRGI